MKYGLLPNTAILPFLLLISCSQASKSGCGGSWNTAPKDAETVDAKPVKDSTVVPPVPQKRCKAKQFKDCVTCYIEKHHAWLSQVDPVWRDIPMLCQALEGGNAIHTWNDPYNYCVGTGEPVPAWVTENRPLCGHLHLPQNEAPNCKTVYGSSQFRSSWRETLTCD